jgi:biotin synthase
MCLTIPAKVIQVNGNNAIVWQYDKAVTIDISFLSDIKEGDWLLYVSDTALKKIDSKDAEEMMELLASKPPLDIDLLNPKFVEVIKNSKIKELTREEIIFLLNSESLEQEALFREAEITRKTYIRDFICVHGIIEFSNYCGNNCNYCGLRKDNNLIKRYRMSVNEIVDTAIDAVNNKGYKLLVLQSGEDVFYTADMLAEIIRRIKVQCKVFIFISIGDRDYETYKKLREAGASGVLYRFETSNSVLFEKIHDKNFTKRFEHLEFLKKLGYFVATGSLIGLPGQSIKDLAEDLLTIKRLGINMVSSGPFIPCEGTPFADFSAGSVDMSLKFISVARLIMKKARIPVVTALETIDQEKGRRYAMRAGANALMFNLTPDKYFNDYKIYPNRFIERNSMIAKYALFNNDGSYKMLEERLNNEII